MARCVSASRVRYHLASRAPPLSGRSVSRQEHVESFDDAVASLARLLAEHDRPTSIVWLGADDLRTLIGRTFVRIAPATDARHAEKTFERATNEGRAIALDVVGHSADHSFARVEVASDERDAELRMMSREHVKVSIPEAPSAPFREIHSSAYWATVCLLAG